MPVRPPVQNHVPEPAGRTHPPRFPDRSAYKAENAHLATSSWETPASSAAGDLRSRLRWRVSHGCRSHCGPLPRTFGSGRRPQWGTGQESFEAIMLLEQRLHLAPQRRLSLAGPVQKRPPLGAFQLESLSKKLLRGLLRPLHTASSRERFLTPCISDERGGTTLPPRSPLERIGLKKSSRSSPEAWGNSCWLEPEPSVTCQRCLRAAAPGPPGSLLCRAKPAREPPAVPPLGPARKRCFHGRPA